MLAQLQVTVIPPEGVFGKRFSSQGFKSLPKAPVAFNQRSKMSGYWVFQALCFWTYLQKIPKKKSINIYKHVFAVLFWDNLTDIERRRLQPLEGCADAPQNEVSWHRTILKSGQIGPWNLMGCISVHFCFTGLFLICIATPWQFESPGCDTVSWKSAQPNGTRFLELGWVLYSQPEGHNSGVTMWCKIDELSGWCRPLYGNCLGNSPH